MLRGGPKVGGAEFAKLPIELSCSEFALEVGLSPYSWQSLLVDELTEPGHPREAYVQVGRKNGKSFVGALVALYTAAKGGQVFLIADSERNLKSALFYEIRTLVAGSPALSKAFVEFKDHFQVPGTGGRISLRPSNLSASQSINPDLVVFDEVHMQKSDAIWNGMSLAGAAAPDALLLGITTPGYDVTGVAHSLYQQVKAGKLWGRIWEPHNGSCALTDMDALRQANPVLEDRPDMLEVFANERDKLPEHDYRRFRLGQWTATASAWLPYGKWDSLKRLRKLEPAERVWLGFDGSYSGDSTALVAVTGDGFLSVIGCWENPGAKGWRVPRNEVEAAISEAMAVYDVRLLLCDPPYWQSEIADWDRRWPNKVVEFPTFSRARMAPACTGFYAAVMDGRLTHDGDPRLARHVANAVVKTSPMGDYITKVDKNSPAKIDLAVAAIIALSAAAVAKPRRRAVFVA